MKHIRRASYSLLVLLPLAVSGCEQGQRLWDEQVKDTRPTQRVPANRTRPELNPAVSGAPMEAPMVTNTQAAMPPAPVAPKAPATPDSDPYAYYGQEQSSPLSEVGDFFGNMFSSSPEATPPAAAEPMRKPLPGNPTEAMAAPVAMVESPVVHSMPDYPQPAAQPPVQHAQAAAEEPSWLERQFDFFDERPAPDPSMDKNAPYPHLSQVPGRPDQFDQLKASHPDQVMDLQGDHAVAQQQKYALDHEPSSMDGQEMSGHEYDSAPALPVEPMMTDPVEPSVVSQPVELMVQDDMPMESSEPMPVAMQPPAPVEYYVSPPTEPLMDAPAPMAMPVEEAAPMPAEHPVQALPAPGILKTVKTLGPGRYSRRR